VDFDAVDDDDDAFAASFCVVGEPRAVLHALAERISSRRSRSTVLRATCDGPN